MRTPAEDDVHWREREFEQHQAPTKARLAIEAWAFVAKRPRLYRWRRVC